MITKSYLDWENIFLDTTMVISLLRSQRDDKCESCNFVKRLLTDLTEKKSKAEKERFFYVSSITISEILNKANDAVKASNIIKALNSENVIFYPFDNDVATLIANHYHPILSPSKQTEYARNLSWPEGNLHIAREWITKDVMIVGTAKFLNCDTILTLDENTMFPVANSMDYSCSLAYEENFQLSQNGKNIFTYLKATKKARETGKKQNKPKTAKS